MIYYVYCGEKGWWGKTGYTSVFAEAKEFTRETAIHFCKARNNGKTDGLLGAVPVLSSDLFEVMEP